LTLRKYVIDSDSEEEIQKQIHNRKKPTPAYLLIQETVLKMMGGCSDGFTFKQIYQMMPNTDPRRIREAVQGLEGKGLTHHKYCRCGSARVYYKS
jgi:hypothetical protein